MGAYWTTGYWHGGAAGYWTGGYWYGPSEPSDEYDSIYWRILKAVRDGIKNGGFLTGIDADRVHLQKVPNWRDPIENGVKQELKLPCVIVYPPGGVTDTDRGTNARDDFGYPVGILWVFADQQDQEANFSRELMYQEKLRRRFCRRRLGIDDDSGCQYTCTQQRANTYDQVKFFREGYAVGLMQLQFMTRESRDYE